MGWLLSLGFVVGFYSLRCRALAFFFVRESLRPPLVSVFNSSAAVLSTDPYHLRRDLTLMALNFNRIGDFSTFASGWARWACEYVGVLFSPFFYYVRFCSLFPHDTIFYEQTTTCQLQLNYRLLCFSLRLFHTFIISIYEGIFFYAECRPLHTCYAPIIQFILSIRCDVLQRERWQSCPHTSLFVHTQAHTHFFPGVKYNFNFHNIFLVSSNFHPAGRQTLFFFVFIYVILSTIYISQFADLNILIRLSAELDFMRSLACG